MRIEVRASNVAISEALALHIRRKLELALRRHAVRVEDVVVRLVDQNGPKGGPDKRCTMSAHLSSPVESVLAAATDADAYVAVGHAAARLGARATRAIRRDRRPSRARRPSRRARLEAAAADEA
ncbi:MAG: HPF/RaiA family ribosome-associated protein [Labilithrix sp.]|nr:HPF/RaiA family ribosome-associated protein [Labilithrix sp.]